MAGDWIKMRTDLYRDPKVCTIADLLISNDSELSQYVSQNMQREMAVTRNVMRNVTVGALVSVWGVLRHRGKRVDDDLCIKFCSASVVDDLSEIPGFGSAMCEVGWLVETDEGIVLPRFFEEFNVDPLEESRARNAERQRRYREKQAQKSNVTVASKSNAREEKRREEKDKTLLSGKPDASAAEVITYLNEKAGKAFREVKSNLALVASRLREGASVEDCKAVIDAKVRDWSSDPKMRGYLRPGTLFNATKFAQYIGEIGSAKVASAPSWVMR